MRSPMSIQPSAATPDVDKHYYSDGLRWETAVYRSAVGSRNIWRTISVLLGVALILALATLYALAAAEVPRSRHPARRQDDGLCRGRQPLEPGGELTQRESVTRANIVRFVRARETYDPKGSARQFRHGLALFRRRRRQGFAGRFATSNPTIP